MDAKLVVVGGKANKSLVSVKLPTVIGRSRQADLTVAHPMVSRKHCELYEADGLLMIRDLGSLNGLYVNGKQVSEAPLYPNAEFAVGPLTFRVEYEYTGEGTLPVDASTVDLETPDVEFIEGVEAGEDTGSGEEAGGFDLNGADAKPADGREATEAPPDLDGFPPGDDAATVPKKAGPVDKTMAVPKDPGATEPDPGLSEVPPQAAPPDARQPPAIPPGEDERGTVPWGVGQDEETVDDESGDYAPRPGASPEEPEEAEPGDEDLDEFLKGFE
jgi:pSer/pThr/pTyr-binding forkhead associated (FHA) protein